MREKQSEKRVFKNKIIIDVDLAAFYIQSHVEFDFSKFTRESSKTYSLDGIVYNTLSEAAKVTNI